MASEKICLMNISTSFLQVNKTESSIDVENLGVSQIGPRLLNEIFDAKITGFSGEFVLVNGKLQQSTFEVFNMIGQEQNVVGYWTQDKGLSRNLGSTKRSTLSNSSKLKNIIWPGHSIKIPKGWNIPKLKVGIPKHEGFTQFVEIQRNPYTNETKCTGFSCDVFLATLDALDFEVPCEFVPFMNAEGRSAGTYDELLYQIEDKKVDIVVGDTTIVANRTSYVDFTLPYSESGVTMLVPIKRDKRKNMWIFLRPWSWVLWLAVVMYSIFTGIAIRIIEHGTPNTEFQGSTTRQVGLSKLVPYHTIQEYHNALSKGSENGGVAAIFDEIPYVRVFLAKYGSEYMMSGPTYKTDGFGFAFPLESRLVSYFSTAILRVRENKTLDDIEKRYFAHELTSQSDNADPIATSSPSLDVYSFGGLFIITGVATLFALFISQSWLWQKPVAMAKDYTQKYLASHSPNNTEEIVIQSTTGNEMNVTEQSSVPEVESTSENPPRMSNLQIDENVSAEQAK
ncbi:glutamate receptor 2.9-like [Pistacia vera]|uniref:glutamate receptor 2.9-like n=1 Tax=Pistacia vera TaxID=55513 RepID=UPI0012636FAA|nr:glutamate receptor 2.9-like [Pistacia vera]